MKKLLFLILLIPLYVNAEVKDLFKIDVPENMNNVINKNSYYKWIYKDKEFPYFTLSMESNNNYNIDLFNEKDALDYEKYVLNEINNDMSEYDVSANVYDSKILNINNRSCLKYYVKLDTIESFGYDIYFDVYVFTTKNYLSTLTFVYNSEEELNSNMFSDVISSFKINDEDIIIKKDDYKYVLFFTLGGGFIGLLLGLIFFKKRRR